MTNRPLAALRSFTAILLTAGSIATSIINAETPSDETIYRREADTFIAGIPKNLSQRQTEAVRRAISGDSRMLDSVRSSRNTTSDLPSDVKRLQVGDHLALFRRDRYDNDTLPLLVYFHGGGWTIGSINSCSRFCAAVARNGIAVLAVDYRLAPEHPFPAGLDDCVQSVKTAIDSLDAWKCSGISLGGDSSGGNLAIATALSFPANTFNSLVTFYPVTKAYNDSSASWHKFDAGFGLDGKLMDAFNDAYTSETANPLVSPADAPDAMLRVLPPTMILAADRDILKDQGAHFANRISSLGIATRYEVIPGSVHLFITVPGQAASFNRAVSTASEFIQFQP